MRIREAKVVERREAPLVERRDRQGCVSVESEIKIWPLFEGQPVFDEITAVAEGGCYAMFSTQTMQTSILLLRPDL
jgi:hypothetical protein